MRPNYYKHINDLTEEDFDAFPVWVCAYNTDIDEEWFDEDPADEATYMPWQGQLPYRRSRETSFRSEIAKCSYTLNDGTLMTGFASPLAGNEKTDDLGYLDPLIFVGGNNPKRSVGFWSGVSARMHDHQRKHLYETLRKTSKQIFPIDWEISEDCFGKRFSGTIAGFGYLLPPDYRDTMIET